MRNPTTVRDDNLRRLVYDFDALADVLHDLLDRDFSGKERAAAPPHSVGFTTEWQMAIAAEDARS